MIALIASRHKILRELGIRPVEKPGAEAPSDAAVLAKRHGRRLEYGASAEGNFWRSPKAAPIFRVENRGGEFYAGPTLPSPLRRLLGQLPKNRIWRGLSIVGGSAGIQTNRPVRLAKYYLHDLWLLEKILDSLDK